MKEPNLAPFYGAMYPGLADIARKYGYALTIHGTLARDFDLVAIPWNEMAVDAEILVECLFNHVNALLYPKLLELNGLSEKQALEIYAQNGRDPETKPHGRRSWSLHLGFGSYIDLSVMPKQDIK